MQDFEKAVLKVRSGYGRFLEYVVLIGSMAILLLMLYTSTDVVGRFFSMPAPSAWEFSRVFLVIIVFASLAPTQARGGHLFLEFLWTRFGRRGKAAIHAATALLGLVIFSIVTWQSWLAAIRALERGEDFGGSLGIPFFPAKLFLTFGALLLAIQYLIDLTYQSTRAITAEEVEERQ